MGHYRADLACDRCQEVRCRCERAPEDETKIILDDGRTLAKWREDRVKEINSKEYSTKFLEYLHKSSALQMLNMESLSLKRKT